MAVINSQNKGIYFYFQNLQTPKDECDRCIQGYNDLAILISNQIGKELHTVWSVNDGAVEIRCGIFQASFHCSIIEGQHGTINRLAPCLHWQDFANFWEHEHC